MSLEYCHVCNSSKYTSVKDFEKVLQITSDCRPWNPSGRLVVCDVCGCIFKPADTKWQAEVAEIYSDYEAYRSGNGNEISVFDLESGTSSKRSERVLGILEQKVMLPENGRLLDVGCGRGQLLSSFHKLRQSWSLYGTDLNEKNRKIAGSLSGVVEVRSNQIQDFDGQFDVISMLHLVEHVPATHELIRDAKDKLSDDGVILILVPYFVESPFDLIVIDHCTHFSLPVMRRLLEAEGLEIIIATDKWIAKELTIVARKAKTVPQIERTDPRWYKLTEDLVAWLYEVASLAIESAETARPFGIFGTGLGGAWFFPQVSDKTEFFVDEDLSRIGTKVFDRPVLSISDIPSGATIFMAVAPELAHSIVKRISRSDISFILPPPLPLLVNEIANK